MSSKLLCCTLLACLAWYGQLIAAKHDTNKAGRGNRNAARDASFFKNADDTVCIVLAYKYLANNCAQNSGGTCQKIEGKLTFFGCSVPCTETCFDAQTQCESSGELCPNGGQCCDDEGPCDTSGMDTCESDADTCTGGGGVALPATCPGADEVCCRPACSGECVGASSECADLGEYCPSGQKCCAPPPDCATNVGFICASSDLQCAQIGGLLLNSVCPGDTEVCCQPDTCSYASEVADSMGDQTQAYAPDDSVATLDDCKNICLQTTGCVALDFKAPLCNTYTATQTTTFAAGTVYVQLQC